MSLQQEAMGLRLSLKVLLPSRYIIRNERQFWSDCVPFYSIFLSLFFCQCFGLPCPMTILFIYTYIAAGILFLLLLQRYILRVPRFLFNPRLFVLFSKHLILPYLFRRHSFWGPISRLRAGLHMLHLIGTFACNIIGVHDKGIAAQLPYVEELLEFQRSTKDTGGRQKISLIWQLDQECKFFSRSCIE